MSFMDWNSSYEIGVAIFDEEHRKLAGIIKTLHGHVTGTAHRQDLLAICDQLIEYTALHFRHEEMYFEDCGYPDADRHIAMHAEIRKKVVDFRERVQATDDPQLAGIMLDYLQHWYLHHTQVEDAKYARYLQNHHLQRLAG